MSEGKVEWTARKIVPASAVMQTLYYCGEERAECES